MGVDALIAYRRHHLSEAFRFRYRHILDQRRGAGCWLWKPYVIQDCMRRADDGDIVVYADSGVLIRRPLYPLIEQADRFHLVLFANDHTNAPYVKRDCFVLTGTDTPYYHHARQLNACFMLVKNTHANRRFVDSWLDHCTDDRILTDKPNECGFPNLAGFVAHRRDQAVLSLLYWRERNRLTHLLCEPEVLHAHLRQHRRRSARMPILAWYYCPDGVRRAIRTGWRAMRRNVASVRRAAVRLVGEKSGGAGPGVVDDPRSGCPDQELHHRIPPERASPPPPPIR